MKTRCPEAWRRPAAAVAPGKQRRVAATARDYLRLIERSDILDRYDIVDVLLKEGRVKEIRHQPNAFAPARKSR